MHTRLLGTLVATAYAGSVTSTTAQVAAGDAERYEYWQHMMGWSGGWYSVWPVIMIVLIGVTIGGVVVLARATGTATRSPYPMPPGKTALDMLKERFARGEIDKAEFEDKRRALGE